MQMTSGSASAAGPSAWPLDAPATPGLTFFLLCALAFAICAPYFALQQLALEPVHEVPRLPPDALAFAPSWAWAYASLFVLFPLSAHLARTRRDLLRFAWGIGALCLVAFPIFLLLPVAGPRPGVAVESALYQGLVAVDAPGNAFPSLHAAFTVFCAAFAWRVRAAGVPRAVRRLAGVGLLAWTAAILFATLAIKQHWAVDVLAGAALGAGAHAAVWRRRGQAACGR